MSNGIQETGPSISITLINYLETVNLNMVTFKNKGNFSVNISLFKNSLRSKTNKGGSTLVFISKELSNSNSPGNVFKSHEVNQLPR